MSIGLLYSGNPKTGTDFATEIRYSSKPSLYATVFAHAMCAVGGLGLLSKHNQCVHRLLKPVVLFPVARVSDFWSK